MISLSIVVLGGKLQEFHFVQKLNLNHSQFLILKLLLNIGRLMNDKSSTY